MRNEKFFNLRKEKSFSQARLAEEFRLPVSTIRAWEYGLSSPSIPYMQKMAKLLDVGEDVIASIFMPEKTRVEEENEKEAEIYDKLVKVFWECTDIESFIQFGYLFSLGQISGVISCDDYIFPFTKVMAEEYGSVIVLSDSSDNLIVLSITNIIEVEPISVNYDVYTFDLVIDCPMFPTDLKYLYHTFNQRIRLSFFNR